MEARKTNSDGDNEGRVAAAVMAVLGRGQSRSHGIRETRQWQYCSVLK
jgi:hypothetical protein